MCINGNTAEVECDGNDSVLGGFLRQASDIVSLTRPCKESRHLQTEDLCCVFVQERSLQIPQTLQKRLETAKLGGQFGGQLNQVRHDKTKSKPKMISR